MPKSALLSRTFFLLFLSLMVYLGFRFLLPLFFPFLLAYLTMRILYPAMNYVHDKWKLPKILSHYGLLTLFFAGSITVISFLLWKILGQLRLLFCNFPIYRQILEQTCISQASTVCRCIDGYLGLSMGTSQEFLHGQYQQMVQTCSSYISEESGQAVLGCLSSSIHIFMVCGFFIVALIILVKEMGPIGDYLRSNRFYLPLHRILSSVQKSGFIYLKTEALILIINWFVCSFALFLIRNPYFFLLGMLIAVLDALPVIGSGLFLVPWSIFEFLGQHYFSAAVLITAYLISLFTREIMEAKLLGKGMGLNPFFMLAAIYVGVELFGAAGLFLGPIGAVLIRALASTDSA